MWTLVYIESLLGYYSYLLGILTRGLHPPGGQC